MLIIAPIDNVETICSFVLLLFRQIKRVICENCWRDNSILVSNALTWFC